MGSANLLLRNALILDTETLSLDRGSGIRELAIYSFEKREIYDLVIKPNFIAIKNTATDEALALVTRSSDTHTLYQASTWGQLLPDWLRIRGYTDPSKTDEYLTRGFAWLDEQRKKIPELQDRAETPAERAARAAYIHRHSGATLLPSEVIDLQSLLAKGGKLEELLAAGDPNKGKVLWIANAAFESKQLGAAYAALEEKGVGTSLATVKGSLETHGPTVDPFYVTGVKVNAARSRAVDTKDWTPVWQAYLEELPTDAYTDARGKFHAARSVVRDPQDVLRAMASYGQKLGIRGSSDVYSGTGLDIMHRLFGSLHDAKLLSLAESHRAAEDTAIHTKTVVETSLEWTEALQNVWEETPEGARLIAEAKEGKGTLHDVRVFFARQKVLEDELANQALWQRLGRGTEDLLRLGRSPQTDGSRIVSLSQQTPDGENIKLDIRMSNRVEQSSLEEIVELMRLQDRPVPEDALAQAMPRLNEIMAMPASVEERRMLAQQHIDSLTRDYIPNQIAAKQHVILGVTEGIGGRNAPITTRSMARAMPKASTVLSAADAFAERAGITPLLARAIEGGKAAGGIMAGVAAVGGLTLLAAQMRRDEPSGSNSSLVNYDYQEWLEHQQEFMGTGGQEPDRSTPYMMRSLQEFMGSARGGAEDYVISTAERTMDYSPQQLLQSMSGFYSQRTLSEYREGMSHRGLAGRSRAQITDFGSPYQGIMGSQMVFAQQDVLEEREKWLRQQYALTYDPNGAGWFGMRNIISRARHTGYSYVGGTTAVADGYGGLKKRGLRALDLNSGRWKVEVDDADTVLIKRAGIRGLAQSVFGGREQYSFRMSGIDAPEVAHRDEITGEPLYHTPQPAGFAGARALQAILDANKGQLELLIDPSESTYGRQLGVLFAGGTNVNYELVRRGNAAFLPFGKEENDMLDWGALGALQRRSAQIGRGMWQHPYWQAYYGVSQTSGESITFNTFTRMNKIAQSQSTMDTLALMEHAENSGFYSNAMALEASRIGIMTHVGPDKLTPVVTGRAAAHYDSYLHEVLSDTNNWMKTHGTGYNQNKFSARGGYRNLDKALVLDSMGNTDSIWSKRRLAAFDRYATTGKKELRRYRQMMMQQEANQNIFNSNIHHYEYN
jgi:endonuclease YncB( thermonuclease family)